MKCVWFFSTIIPSNKSPHVDLSLALISTKLILFIRDGVLTLAGQD